MQWLMALLLLGCIVSGSVIARPDLGSLEVGMSRDEVVRLLGEPRGRGSDGRREILIYGVDQEVHLEDGVVHLVTGAGGVIQERAPRSVIEHPEAAPTEAVPTMRVWSESSVSGPSFSFEMDEDVPAWMLFALLAFFVFVMVISIAEMWCIFVKAGRSGWTCLVPLYNAYVMLKIAGMSGWWLFPPLILFVSLVLSFRLAERFGKGAGFGLGLMMFPVIFYPILAFGSAEYQPL